MMRQAARRGLSLAAEALAGFAIVMLVWALL
jgi:hypothetical protein